LISRLSTVFNRFASNTTAIWAIELERNHKDAPVERLCNCEQL